MSTKKKFPNGFTSWMETHHEVVSFISEARNDAIGVVGETQGSHGTCALYTLAEKWTDEFETLNKGREWDGEFLEEIEAFSNKKNKL